MAGINTPFSLRVSYINNAPCVVVLVGLPNINKTYIGKKLCRYFNWNGVKAKVFSIDQQNQRRQSHIVAFYGNDEKCSKKPQIELGLLIVKKWLSSEGNVAIIDGTNASRHKRDLIYDFCCVKNSYKLSFIEVIEDVLESNCDDYEVLFQQSQMNNSSDKYEHMDEIYDKKWCFVKMFLKGHKFLVNRMSGYLHSQITYYLMNMRFKPRTIFITRHGESEMNLRGRIGGDSILSENGMVYAKNLGIFVKNLDISDLTVWTSLLKRTIQTAEYIEGPKTHWKALNEIHAGVCEGLTYEEIAQLYPAEMLKRDKDKFDYRYPCGESYRDVCSRLDPVIMELGLQENILVISHQAVCRCLLAYFLNRDDEDLPYIDVPLHTVIKLNISTTDCSYEFIKLDENAVSTYRQKPTLNENRSFEEVVTTIPNHPL